MSFKPRISVRLTIVIFCLLQKSLIRIGLNIFKGRGQNEQLKKKYYRRDHSQYAHLHWSIDYHYCIITFNIK